MPASLRTRRSARAAVTAILGAIVLSACGDSDSPGTSVVEAETLPVSAEKGNVVTDRRAGDEKALRMFGNDTARREVALGASRSLIVRARADACEGDPNLRVTVDGETAIDEPVTWDEWANYGAEVDIEDGSHEVAVSLVDDLATDECDRSLFVDRLTFSGERLDRARLGRDDDGEDAGTAGGPSRKVFQADFRDGISEYPVTIHPERIRVVDDPVLGDQRKVLKFRVFNGDTGPTENPRAQIETPFDFREGDDRYFGYSVLFPEEFPDSLPDRAWVTLGEQAYGPPFAGAASVGLRVQNVVDEEGLELRWQRNKTYDYDIPWRGPRIDDIRGRWVDIVQRIRLDSDPDEGFVELWMNIGEGWRRQELFGQDRLYMETYDYTADEGPNNSRLSLYYSRDVDGPLTLYHGAHNIATAGTGAFEAVDPRSYDR